MSENSIISQSHHNSDQVNSQISSPEERFDKMLNKYLELINEEKEDT